MQSNEEVATDASTSTSSSYSDSVSGEEEELLEEEEPRPLPISPAEVMLDQDMKGFTRAQGEGSQN